MRYRDRVRTRKNSGMGCDRRSFLRGGVGAAAAAGNAVFAPAVHATVRPQGALSAMNPVIDDVVLMDKGAGPEVVVTGSELGSQLGFTCLRIVGADGKIAPVRPTMVGGTELVGRVELVPEGMEFGRVMVATGVGFDNFPDPGMIPSGFSADGPTFVWVGDGQPATISSEVLDLSMARAALQKRSSRKGCFVSSYHFGSLVAASGTVLIDLQEAADRVGGACPPGTRVNLLSEMDLVGGPTIMFDWQGELSVVGAGLPFAVCVTSYCSFIQAAVNSLLVNGVDITLTCGRAQIGGREHLEMIGAFDNNDLDENGDPRFKTFDSSNVTVKIETPC